MGYHQLNFDKIVDLLCRLPVRVFKYARMQQGLCTLAKHFRLKKTYKLVNRRGYIFSQLVARLLC